MMFDISVDTEELIVDAYPMMLEADNQGVLTARFDIAWGFYLAMGKRHPEMMEAFTSRMSEMVEAVQAIKHASDYNVHGINTWFTTEELNNK